MKRVLLLAALCAACAPGTPTAPTPPSGPNGPPITLAPAATPQPGPSIPPPSKGTPSDEATPPPDGTCPPEALRGWAYYRADWPGGSCVGSEDCARVNDAGGFPLGALIAFDSTAHPKKGGPMPPGCPVPPTRWTIAPLNILRTQGNEPFAMQSKFVKSGFYVLTSYGSPGAEAESDVVVIHP